MGNVLNFPDRFSKDKHKPTTKTEMKQNIAEFRMGYIDDISDFISNIMLMEMDRAGFSFEEEDLPDILFTRDSLKSLMMKKHGFRHPIQEIVTSSLEDEEEDTEEENAVLTNEEESDSVTKDE